MQCQICGQTAMPGARLCAPCKKALKRARHDTVSVVEPLLARASRTIERRKARRAAKREAEATPPASIIPPPLAAPRSSRSPLLLALLAVPVCVFAYVAVQHLGAAAGADGAPATRAESGRERAASPPSAVVRIAPESTPLPVAALPPSPEPAEPPHAPPVRNVAPLPRKAPAPTIAVAPVEVASPPAPAVVPPPEPAPAPPPPPRVVAPPDRGQLIGSAFARCPRDNLVETALCEQRARIQYCDGYWGQFPQCPAARDYGQ